MAFNFGAPKSTGFTLPTTSAPVSTTGLQFNLTAAGGGDANAAQAKPSNLFSLATSATPALSTTVAPFNVNTSTLPTSATATPALPQFNASAATLTSSAAPTLNLLSKNTLATPSSGFSLGATSLGATPSLGVASSVAPLSFGTIGATSTAAAPTFSLGVTPSLASTTIPSALPPTGSMTFVQLEDAINKWTIDLEEQGKVFGSLAKHLNAWDRLLITNGEKVLNVSNGIDKIKQQQQQLDQELDFVLAQQKELEDCIVPLENELKDVTVTDMDRDQTYKLAENIDANLKQMSEDLKEIIEQLNESNKSQEQTDPVAQIGRILNAHMNSLQWIDRNTSQICSQLDEISKMHDLNRRNHDNLHGA